MKIFVFDLDGTVYNQYLPFRNAIKSTISDEKIIKELFRLSRIYSDILFSKVHNGEMTKIYMHLYRLKDL